MDYTRENTLRIAKRYNNTKRPYLLINPLQAKHLPVHPSDALAMMHTLGDQLMKKYPAARLVIGFAETATAIGAAIASRFRDDCVYIHTTRETFSDENGWIFFQEEHSHATDQKLFIGDLPIWLEQTDTVILAEDEISTGKTIINMVAQLKVACPVLENKRIVAASILNRVSPENEARMADAGIKTECLIKLTPEDYTKTVQSMQVQEAEDYPPASVNMIGQPLQCASLKEPRMGLTIASYRDSCKAVEAAVIPFLARKLSSECKLLVLGTEECMYPALLLGATLEAQGMDVFCHATTRSPIGICKAEDYPIRTGYKLTSFYGDDRATYLYNLEQYDAVVILSDTTTPGTNAFGHLLGALLSLRIPKIFYIQGGNYVWHLST